MSTSAPLSHTPHTSSDQVAPAIVLSATLAGLMAMIWLTTASDLPPLTVALAGLVVSSGLLAAAAAFRQVIARRLSPRSRPVVDIEVFNSCLRCLAAAIDARDSYGREHVALVETVASRIASRLGMPPGDIDGLRTAALLLDVGKLGIPENILLHAGRPSDRDFEAIHNHPIVGAEILDEVPFPWEVQQIIRSHHEKWDGSGYPEGLSGEQTNLGARILAVADVYGALTCNRSYRSKWTHAQAVSYIRSMSGVHFDPAVVRAFLAEEAAILACRPGACACEAARATDSIARANREFVALWQISQSASSSLEMPQLLQTLAGYLGALMDCEAAAVFLMDETEPHLTCHAAWPESSAYMVGSTASLMGTGCGRSARERSSLTIRSSRERLLMPDGALIEAPCVWSAVSALRTEDGKCLGTINLYRSSIDFSIEELDFLDAAARHASVPVANASLYEATRDSAHRDPLTGLYNLRYFCSKIEQEVARAVRSGQPFSLVAVDLDHFKLVNDTLGHPAGDALLRDVARILTGGVREYDTVVRYGGDEFLILLPESGAAQAEETVTRLDEAMKTYVSNWPGLQAVKFGASFGCASFPEDGGDMKALLATADGRMYELKRSKGAARQAA